MIHHFYDSGPEPEIEAFDKTNPQDVSWRTLFPQRQQAITKPAQLELPFVLAAEDFPVPAA